MEARAGGVKSMRGNWPGLTAIVQTVEGKAKSEIYHYCVLIHKCGVPFPCHGVSFIMKDMSEMYHLIIP